MNLEKTTENSFNYGSNLAPSFVEFEFKMGNKIVKQSRQVYSVLDFYSDIGGLLGTVEPIAHVLVALFSGAFYYSHLIISMFPVHNDGTASKDSNGSQGGRIAIEVADEESENPGMELEDFQPVQELRS